MSTATRSSSGAATVEPGPEKRSATATVRSAPDDRRATVAPRHISGPPVSMAGEAFIRLPPSVPWARVACDPTIVLASASAVKRSRTSGCAAISACVASAPRCSPPFASSMPRSSPMRWIATSDSGSGALPWRAPTTRSVPPATGRAPPASAASASSRFVAVANAVALTRRPPRPAPASSAAAGRARR